MISICIPTYNCTVYNLAVSLVEQCFIAQIEYEVICIDDASGTECRKINFAVGDISNVVYMELEQNIGRSAIRNLFLNYAKYEYLLFLDCDSEIPDNQFIKKYIDAIKKTAEVVCGGRGYGKKPDDKTKLLRWKYGSERECTTAVSRQKKPFRSFLSNNFLIRKDIFSKIRFDERIREYGHEDTLFGHQLLQNNIQVLHIENPTIHKHIENATVYLLKTQQALKNIYFIQKVIKPGKDFYNSVKLLKVFNWINMAGLRIMLAMLYVVSRPVCNYLLTSGKSTSLVLFDYYKLGFLCHYSIFRYNKID